MTPMRPDRLQLRPWQTLKYAAALVVLAAAGIVPFRHWYYESAAEERSGYAHQWMTRGFTVAVVWPPHTDFSLVEGVKLAYEEMNAAGGPLAGKVKLRFITERADGGATAHRIADSPDTLAVIGHELSDNVIPSSLIYQEHGILFLSPKSTDERLTSHRFNFVFRLTPSDPIVTRDMARFAQSRGWTRVGVIYGQHAHGVAASGQFLAAAKGDGIEVPFFKSYLPEADWVAQDLRPMVAEIRKRQFDAVMIADQLPSAARLLVNMAQLGVSQPVLATDKLDSEQVWTLARRAANNLYVASAVDPDSAEPAYVAFRERFRRRFGGDPGYGAAQGYEAFHLFAEASTLSQSADPITVATTLRTVKKWNGLFGEFAFDEDGDVLGRDVSIKRMADGRFTTVSTIEEDVPQ